MSSPIGNMLPSASSSGGNSSIHCTSTHHWPSSVQCHHCDNRRKLECQSRRRVKLKLDQPSLPMRSSAATTAAAVHLSTTAAAILDDRLDRCDALQSTLPTVAAATMRRSNHSGGIASDRPFYHHQCSSSVSSSVAAANHNTQRASTQWPSVNMARTCSQPSRLILPFLSLCLCLSVISASHYNENELPPYSQYYPPYLAEEKIPGQNRQGKSNSRTFAKAPAVNPNVDTTRQFLDSSFSGGEISGYKVLRRTQVGGSSVLNQFPGPDYRITSDIIVLANAKLEIEPGVRLAFAPRTGLTVRGSLLANGTSSSKIVFTSNDSGQWSTATTSTFSSSRSFSSAPDASKPIWPNIRLVDGSSTFEGRLQLNYKGRWHSVCTNSRNWTQLDVQVVCKQFGFANGHWYRWFLRNNQSRQFMFESPACRGDERSIENCANWPSRRVGSGVCDFHQDIGIRCDLKEVVDSSIRQPNWRGISFYYADSRVTSTLSNKMDIHVSKSYLEHVIIEYAGIGLDGTFTSALNVHGSVPPFINELTVRRSAYTALNITEPVNGFHLSQSRFIENRGYGVFINSSIGRILLSSIEVEENGADGIRFVHFEKPFYSTDSFCQTSNLGYSQVFPIRYTHNQDASKAPTEECCQEFYAKDWEGQRITAHFPVLMSGIDDNDIQNNVMPDLLMPHTTNHIGREGSIYVVDGNRIIADFFVRNGTKVQSVSSIFGNGPMRICYRPAHYRKVLFSVEVVIDYGREYDMVVSDSRVVANNGRGIWLQDLRSGSVLNRTLVASHDYVAGVHVSDGVGNVIVNNSVISNNVGDGLNVTTGGGYLHLDRTEVSNNTQSGMAVWFNESIGLQAFNYSSYVSRSTLIHNQIGLLISSGCHFQTPARPNVFWNISMNHINQNGEQAILYHSCIPRPRILKMQMVPSLSNISISHNHFEANGLQAIHAAPFFFAKMSLMHNVFMKHQKAVLYINTRDSFDMDKFVEEAERFPFAFQTANKLSSQRKLALDSWPAIVRIRNNNFKENIGHYVASIGLLEPQSWRVGAISSLPQKVMFTRNILTDNVVSEQFESLNTRSKVSAVLCITSSNVQVWRNEFVNSKSKYELGIHLTAHYRLINASLNYWGTKQPNLMPGVHFEDHNVLSAASIYERIFDRKNRYNLAQVEFLPYILMQNALESERESLSQVNDREKVSQFFTGVSTGEIGGQVKGQVNLPSGVYNVKRDIYVSPEGELVLNPGTELRFDQSVGIFVQGKFKAKGTSNADIKLLLDTSSSPSSYRRVRDTQAKLSKVKTNTTIFMPIPLSAMNTTMRPVAQKMKIGKSAAFMPTSVRLSNGTEGRLEVKVGIEWGTVCGYNFDIEDAAVACHQLGFVLSERDWRLEKSEFWSAGNSRSILLSNVQCDHLDTDLTKCKAERASDNDFEGGWCPMGEVGIRCYAPAWAGIRFGMLTQEATIESVTVEKAGLFDYRTRRFVPALQFDFNRFTVRNSIIRNNIDSGIGLMWNDVLSEPMEDKLQIETTKVSGNLNHGIITRTQGIKVKDCHIIENKASGFYYEPNFSREEQEDLTSWVVRQVSSYSRRVSVLTIPSTVNSVNSQYNQSILLDQIGQHFYVHIPRRPNPTNGPYRVLISTEVGRRIGVMAISPIFQTRSSESLRLYSPQLESGYIPKMMWDLRHNLTAFPFVYPGYRLVLEYNTGEFPYGGVLLLFTPKQYPRSVPGAPTIAEQEILEQRQMNTMLIQNNKFIENGRGYTASHCSMNVDFNGNYCKRYGNETIHIEKNLISKSAGAGLFVNSYALSSTIPYSLMLNLIESNEPPRTEYDPSFTSSIIAEINYTLIENSLTQNGDFGSIVLYDHSLYENGDMQRSSLQLMPGYLMSSAIGSNYPSNTNLFHWEIRNCSLETNRNGGIDIRLPYTWLYNENFTHTVRVEDCRFERNKNFEFLIGGHYAKVNITRNRFLENYCKKGLVSITGMEKLMRIEENEMWDNYVQRYVLELNMASHADKFGTVLAFVRRNVLRNNRYSGPNLRDGATTSDTGGYSPETYAIAIRGVQQVNVTRNILVNRNLQFELLAGVHAGSLYNELDARENWWGVSGDPTSIRERIFDFDDWNSFASTLFSPWLSTDRVDAPIVFEKPTLPEDIYLGYPYLGGRLSQSLVLNARGRPYIVNSDLTVMPGVTLTIRPGVIIEFYPSVGILVLGDLAALGQEQDPITLRPLRRNTTTFSKVKNGEDISFRLGTRDARNRRLVSQPQTEPLVFSKSDIGGVRLCLTETCDEVAEKKADQQMEEKANQFTDSGYPKTQNGRRRHGFLEIYNTTTLQWAPVCDTRFTERNGQVICRQLGFSTLNVFVKRGPRLDMDPTLVSRVNHWPDALECTGSEATLSDCELRTFSKDGYDKKASTYESAPFVYSQAGNSKKILPKDSYYKHIFDNETQEMMFYLNDDWTVFQERSVIQSTSCRHDGNEFIYLLCGEDNNQMDDSKFVSEHWGGVRFALAAFEEPRKDFSAPSGSNILSRSRMQFVRVQGAGVLHGEKNAAIQLVQRSVPMEFVTVERSASHGIEVIAPPDSLSMHQMRIRNNLGIGFNMLLLGASSSESSQVPYQPLGDGPSFTVPYNAFSLVEICDARKELRVGEKVIVYYKYDNRPVDCVKIFTSANPLKRIGLRFLQINLWSTFVEPEGKVNSRKEDYLQGSKFIQQSEDIFHNRLSGGSLDANAHSYIDMSLLNSMSDSILIWDGDIFNETTRRLLGEVYSDSTRQMLRDSQVAQHGPNGKASVLRNTRYALPTAVPPGGDVPGSDAKTRLYKSTGYSLSIQLHASGASSRYGFIAEITTLPSAYHADRVERNLQHNITYSDVTDNNGGALLYRSVGESVPPLALMHNVLSRNCRLAWANFSTCESSSVQLEVQNSLNLYLLNNLISGNRAGGVHIEATSFTAVSALKAELSNNLFSDNLQREALFFEGAEAGHSYQTVHANRNYFTRNRSPHKSNIVFGRAVVKFKENIVINNYGDSQMFMAGFAHAQSSSSLQQCTRNFFYNNHAVNERGEQSTIIVGTVGQMYNDNYLVNPDNNFELATRNRTIITSASFPLKQQLLQPTAVAAVLAQAIVQAPKNWWGFNETSAIEARIRDSSDYYHLIPVDFKQFHSGNLSVLSGACYGGYEKIGDTCFVYVGGRMPYHDARRFCEQDNSSMPFVRASNQYELTRYVYLQQPYFDRRRYPVWVQSFDVPIGSCSVLIDGSVRVHDCKDELPFLCERDPEIGISTATLAFWYQEPLGMAAIAISLITAILSLACMCCWICKSRHRHLEKLERRNSIRASIRSSRSMASMNTINSDGNYFTNRKLLHESVASVNNAGITLANGNLAAYRTAAPRISANPTGSTRHKMAPFTNGSISSASSIFTEPLDNNQQMLLNQKRFGAPSQPNMFDIQHRDQPFAQNGALQHSSNINLLMRPTFDLMYENQAFKGQSTPLSPASFSSRDSHQVNRAWTPDTNSTLDFKVKPTMENRDLSQYTASTDNIHKSLPSSASSSSASEASSPSIINGTSHQPHMPFRPQQQTSRAKAALRAPVHPPPPPPIRRSLRGDPTSSHRKSMDPTLLLHESTTPLVDDSSKDREMLTFGTKKPQQPLQQVPPARRAPFTTDLDTDPIGGSQPSLIYGSYRGPSSIGTHDSNMHYLETSLDGDSFYTDADGSHQGPNSSTASPKSRMYASQPLETAM